VNVTYQALAQGAMLYDGSRLDQMQPEQFEMNYWQSQPNPPELATGGRGTVVFIGGDQFSWALRHYRRGGLPGRVLSDQFLFLGENPTRSFREFRLLAMLYDMGLPVPRPVAARYVRSGAIYRADLITARIPEARPLSSLLDSAELGNEIWANTGKLIRRFHDAGVCHADLNAHNIMVNSSGELFLLDFDRGTIRQDGQWKQANLQRLRRSLDKISGANPGINVSEADWSRLLEAYSE
jgi:3-deoxy-D-manno-octulosonic acid kinase